MNQSFNKSASFVSLFDDENAKIQNNVVTFLFFWPLLRLENL